MKDPKNATILAAHLAALGVRPYLAARCAEEIGAQAHLLHMIAVKDCNEGLQPADERRQETARGKAAAAFAAAQEAAHDAGHDLARYSIQFGGDPRGYVVRVMGLPGNTMGGDESGFGI